MNQFIGIEFWTLPIHQSKHKYKMEKVDKEMRTDIQDQKSTNPGNLLLLIIAIVLGLMVVAFVGGFFTTDHRDGQHNMGAVSGADSAIVTKSDTIKR